MARNASRRAAASATSTCGEAESDWASTITLEDAEVYGRNQVGRPHFAKVLCDKGYVATLQQAFDVYLADDAQAAVERDEPTLEEGIRRIRDGGGFAVARASGAASAARCGTGGYWWSDCSIVGLRGIEVFHSEHAPSRLRAVRRDWPAASA